MKDKKYIDLTFPVHKGMLTFPRYWHPSVDIIKLATHSKEGRQTRKIVMGTHTGTHIDAPLHFLPKEKSIDKIPLDIFAGRAVLISFSNKKRVDQKDLEKKLKGIKNCKRLVIRFGWSKYWSSSSYYKKHPFFTERACLWLVKRGVKLLGMDIPSPDDPQNETDLPNHRILLGGGIILVEYLCNLEKLKGPSIYFISLPLRISGADGSPARVIACQI